MRKGYMLIEMLVPFAITVILEAIFYPVASAAIGKGSGFGYFLYLVGLVPVLLPMIMDIDKEVRTAQRQPRVLVPVVADKPFTLLHLLVVVGIIVILASILFPVFGPRC